ncbi:putative glycolipid-binding domain-containing protein [Reyranella sp.]|uniref:putative glycolipid-binding domain-containing protein n=1 Tax=Reyranella sp. TaxID=1929291 RepID=UPI003C7E1EB9
MRSSRIFRKWRRLDEPGLELMTLSTTAFGLTVRSTLVHAGAEGFGLRYRWDLDTSWRTRTLHVERTDAVETSLTIERTGDTSWRVDGEPRSDLAGCHEVDVSATPFCNSLAIRRLGAAGGDLLALFVDAPALSCQPSRQRYEPLGPRAWLYVDKGVSEGFTARLDLDEDGLVATYEHLFEAL